MFRKTDANTKSELGAEARVVLLKRFTEIENLEIIENLKNSDELLAILGQLADLLDRVVQPDRAH